MMNSIKRLKDWCIVVLLTILTILYLNLQNEVSSIKTQNIEISKKLGIVSIRMYESIEKYSDSFKVPKYIAYNVAYQETGYRGPLHWDYNPKQISSANAVGAMQIIPKYAHYYAGRRVSEQELLSNVELNVFISMKMLRYWYDIHHNWMLACGAYNSGRPITNEYARYAASNLDYKNKWNKL